VGIEEGNDRKRKKEKSIKAAGVLAGPITKNKCRGGITELHRHQKEGKGR